MKLSIMITQAQVNAWLLDSTRTVQELIDVMGVCHAQIESQSFEGQVRQTFVAASKEMDDAEVKRFG
jgi:hypothetical protein